MLARYEPADSHKQVPFARFLILAERRLASPEAAHSTDGVEQRFEKQKLCCGEDDHALQPRYGYY